MGDSEEKCQIHKGLRLKYMQSTTQQPLCEKCRKESKFKEKDITRLSELALSEYERTQAMLKTARELSKKICGREEQNEGGGGYIRGLLEKAGDGEQLERKLTSCIKDYVRGKIRGLRELGKLIQGGKDYKDYAEEVDGLKQQVEEHARRIQRFWREEKHMSILDSSHPIKTLQLEFNINKLRSRKQIITELCENKRPTIYDLGFDSHELGLRIERILHKFFSGVLGRGGMNNVNNGIIDPVEISEIEIPMENIELDTDTLNRIQLSNEVADSVDSSQEMGRRLQKKKRQEIATKSKKDSNVRQSAGGKKVMRVSEEHTLSALEAEIVPIVDVNEELARGRKGNDAVKGSGESGKNSSEYEPSPDESSHSYHEGTSLGNLVPGKRAHWEEGRTSGRSSQGKGRSSEGKGRTSEGGKGKGKAHPKDPPHRLQGADNFPQGADNSLQGADNSLQGGASHSPVPHRPPPHRPAPQHPKPHNPGPKDPPPQDAINLESSSSSSSSSSRECRDPGECGEKGEKWSMLKISGKKLSSTPRFSDQGTGNIGNIEFTGNKLGKGRKTKDKEAREYITKTMNEDISYQKKADRILTYLQNHQEIYCLEWADFELRSIRMRNELVLSRVFQRIERIAKVKLCNLEGNEQVLKGIIDGIAEVAALPKLSLHNVLIHHTKPLVQLAQNCKLEEISFNNCRLKFLDEDKTGEISQIIRRALHLRKFKMTRCMITDLNMVDIKDSLKRNESIQELNLSHNNIGKRGFENLMMAFPRNKTLVSVYLLETLVTTNDIPTTLEQAIVKRGKALDLHLNSIP